MSLHLTSWTVPCFPDTGGGFYRANQEAWKSNSDFKVGAIIVKGGRILSTGYNRIEAHPEAYFGCSFHAEHDAIRKAKSEIQGAKMFVYRFGRKHGHIKTSKPCEFCQQEIAKAELSSVIYVDVDGTLQKSSFKLQDWPKFHQMHSYINDASIYVR